jgi:hypothetical protein
MVMFNTCLLFPFFLRGGLGEVVTRIVRVDEIVGSIPAGRLTFFLLNVDEIVGSIPAGFAKTASISIHPNYLLGAWL